MVDLTILTSTPELAAQFYESLKSWLVYFKQIDLEADWLHDNPDANQG